MYGICADSAAFEVAESDEYFCGFWADCTLKNAAFGIPFWCTSAANPRSASSFSRRPGICTSVGHFIPEVPESVLKLWTGSFCTSPPLSTPRLVAHQLYSANAGGTLLPHRHAPLPHRH